MSLIRNLSNLSSFSRVSVANRAPEGLKALAPVDSTNRADLARAGARLLRVYRTLQELATIAGIDMRARLVPPNVRSTAGLGLDLTTTAAMLESTAEINAAPMSFAPFGPDWTGGSSALLTIDGAYDGSQGSDTLTFEVGRDGVKGVDDLRIRVEDSQGNPIRQVNIRAGDDPDMEYAIGNGLFLTLGPGALSDPDTATMQVFDSVGSAVDPGRPLGGIRNDNPNFEYYPAPNTLPPIVAGNFDVNGESISVAPTDTLDDVVDRINQSAAGVTAVFSPTSERIELVQNIFGRVPTIDLQNDSTNFLQATKLDTAVVTPGIDPESEQALADVGAFSAVQDGSFLVNSVPIAVDTANDSLTTIVGKINASGAGATASFDQATQKVLIESGQGASFLNLDSNGTDLFTALNIPDGRVERVVVGGGFSRRRSYEIADALAAVFAELNYVFQDQSFSDRGASAGSFREPLESALRAALADVGGAANGLFGVSLDDSVNARRRGSYLAVDRRELTDSLQLRGRDVKRFFSTGADNDGFVDRMFQATGQALRAVGAALGQSGTYVDIFA